MFGLQQAGRKLVSQYRLLKRPGVASFCDKAKDVATPGITAQTRAQQNRELIDHVLDLAHSQRSLKMKKLKTERHAFDTGTPEAQVAGFTARIENISKHLLENRKDKSSLRLLQSLQNKRRKELIYLRRTKPEAYLELIKSLGLNERRLRITPKKDQHRSR